MGGGASSLTLRYFTPQEREDYFRPGSFIPRAPEGASAFAPPLPLDGLAIAFARVDAEVESVHASPPPDPVLAFRRDGARPGITTGVFLSAIPPVWANDPQGQAAVTAMLDRLTGWSEQDRYDIRLTFADQRLTVSVVIVAADGEMPATLSGTIQDAAGAVQGLALRPIGEAGRFEGRVAQNLGVDAARGTLVLEEPGRSAQRIPLYLPARSSIDAGGVTESFAFGINAAVLARVADGTGGKNLAQPYPGLETAMAKGASLPLHPWLIVLALVALTGSLWVGGTRP